MRRGPSPKYSQGPTKDLLGGIKDTRQKAADKSGRRFGRTRLLDGSGGCPEVLFPVDRQDIPNNERAPHTEASSMSAKPAEHTKIRWGEYMLRKPRQLGQCSGMVNKYCVTALAHRLETFDVFGGRVVAFYRKCGSSIMIHHRMAYDPK